MTSSKAVVVLWAFVVGLGQTLLIKRSSELKKDILDQILPKNENDILVSPGNGSNGSTAVEMSMHILGVDGLNEEKMDFTVRFLLCEKWKDERLVYDANKGHIEFVTINDAEAIWTPDVFVSNEKKSHVALPSALVKISPDGFVHFTRKLSVTAACLLDLRRFPFDTQECTLTLGAFSSTTEDMITLVWTDAHPVTASGSLHLSLFDLEKLTTDSKDVSLNVGGIHSYLTVSFYFSRNLGYYIYHYYIPLTMMVLLSWIPFWLNKTALTPRLLIGMSTLLTSAVVVHDHHKHLPKVSYSTCMDCFTGACLSFIFLSVIETVIVNNLSEKIKVDVKELPANGEIHKTGNEKIAAIKVWVRKTSTKLEHIDAGAKIVFPLLYAVFCAIYFIVGNFN